MRTGLRFAACALSASVAVAGLAQPARAQLAGSISIDSDYRLRSRTLSAGRPTASLQISYDHPSGLYLTATGIGVASKDGAGVLGYQLNAGYAKRLGSDISVEAGVIRSQYGKRYSIGRAAHYTEAYVGITRREVAARVYYSPGYFYKDYESLYGEIDTGFEIAPKWRLNAHAGAMTYLHLPTYYYGSSATRYDWQVGASRRLGSFEIRAALSGGGPGKQYYDRGLHNLTTLTVGASFSF